MRTRTHSLTAAILALGVTAGILVFRALSPATGETETSAALARFSPPRSADGEAAAIVNGEVVLARDVDLLVAASEAAGNPVSAEAALAGFIDRVLLHQAATREGLGPSGAEVDRALDEIRSLASPESVEVVLELNAKAGHKYESAEAYWADPQRKVSLARDLAIAALQEQLTAGLTDPGDRERAIQEELEQLRAAADIEIFAP